MAKPLDPPPLDNAPADAKAIPEDKRAYMTLDTWTRLRAWLGLLRNNVRGVVNIGTGASAGTSIDGLPLSGWAREGGDGLSSFYSGGAVLMRAGNSSGQTLANATPTTITGYTTVIDTASSFNASTGVYTVPVRGYYLVEAGLIFAAGNYVANSLLVFRTQLNSAGTSTCLSTFNYLGPTAITTANIGALPLSGIMVCSAGDTISILCQQNSGASQSLYAGGPADAQTYNHFSITKVG